MAILPRKITSLKRKDKGFTLTEVLIVIAIILVLLLIALWSHRVQLLKGRDSRRKADIDILERVFEDYYNDHDCYPQNPEDLIPNYLSEFPKDPVTRKPYEFSTEGCDVYRIYARLEWEQDPAIGESGCGAGCGPGGGTEGGSCAYNYGVSSPNAGPEDCESCTNGCQGAVCNVLRKDQWDCPRWFCDTNCEGMCSNPAYHCTRIE